MRQRYDTMIQSKYSTLWEGWTTGDGTINHAWAGGPLILMSQYVAGVAPTQPGYAEFQIIPQLAEVTEVAATVPSRKGAISVDIKRGPPFTMLVQVPAGTLATVGVPIEAVTTNGSGHVEVSIDGAVVFAAGAVTPAAVKFAGEGGGYVKFVLNPGPHTLTAREL